MFISIKERLEKTFHKIFDNTHLIYTLLFFLCITLISLFCLTPNSIMGNIALFIATTSALTFIFMMIVSLYPQLEDTFFLSEKIFEKRKIFSFLALFLVSFIIILLYFLLGSSDQLPIQFLGWDLALPVSFIIVYFGWNIIQIFFIKSGFEVLSGKIDNKLIGTRRHKSNSKFMSGIFLVIALIISLLMQIGTFIGFKDYFQPQNSGDPLDPLYWYFGWNIVMFFIIFLISLRLILLFIQSSKKGMPNIFSSVFYLLIWMIIWFRSFNFVNSFRTVSSAVGVDVFRISMDILLMILTSIIVLRGLGHKVYKFRIFTPNNLPFFLFSFAILYIEGQVIMITGAGTISSIYTDFKQVSLINNFLVLIVSVIFYWWYAKHCLEKRGFIFKDSFKPDDIFTIIKDFQKYLEERSIIEYNKLKDQDIQSFLENKKILIINKEPKKDKEPDIVKKRSEQRYFEIEPIDLDIDDNLS